MSGLIAGFERREEGWKHDRTVTSHEIKVLDRERAAAELRRDIALKSLELHSISEKQHEEVLEFYRDKFSGFGLYTFLSRTLQQLHRMAFGNALAVAQLAERAYHYELPATKSSTSAVNGKGRAPACSRASVSCWISGAWSADSSSATDPPLEITQSFSLEQIAPQELIALRETGTAKVRIREFDFDLFYPGHYRRQIRAVRVSIPSVAGPYTNISATLTLLRSRIRSEAQPEPEALETSHLSAVPPWRRAARRAMAESSSSASATSGTTLSRAQARLATGPSSCPRS